MIVRQTAKELLAASIMELDRTKTVEKITVKEIVQNCGLTSTTFYHYFQDKYQLLAWIYNRKAEALFAEKNVIYTWPQLLRALCTPLMEHRSFYENVLKNTAGNDSFLEKATKYVLTLLNNRITCLLSNGELEAHVGLPINQERSRVMICGNPDMVQETRQLLTERGLTLSLRGKPGNLAVENYW